MQHLTLTELLKAVKGTLVMSADDCLVKRICTDSRELLPGDCFVALEGACYDGHNFISQAIARQAAAIIVNKWPVPLPGRSESLVKEAMPPVIKVFCTFTALEDLARHHLARSSLSIVAVTGSLGKTTTKELIYQLLAPDYSVLKSPKSFNNNLGVPLTLLQLETQHQIAVLELGANAFGEIANLSKMITPDIAVITCVAESHLAGFVDLQGVEQAKGEITAGMKADGKLIVNGDDPACRRIADRYSGKVLTFGCQPDVDLRAQNITAVGADSFFDLNGCRWNVPLPGEHNVANLLAAIAVGEHFGLSHSTMRQRTPTLKLPPMRLEISEYQSVTLINDAYNSSPQAAIAAIKFLKQFPAKRKVAILGSMLELGSDSDKLHRQVGEKIANIDVLCVVGEETRELIAGAIAAGISPSNIFFFPDTTAACARIPDLLESGDAVLLKASRRIGLERLVALLADRQQ